MVLVEKRYGLPHPELSQMIRETSGLVVIAKQRSSGEVSAAFELVVLTAYWHLLKGGVSHRDRVQRTGWYRIMNSEVGKNAIAAGHREIKVDEDRAEWSETIFNRIEEAGALTLVEAMLQTGRQHQVRASLLSLGYPLVGDKIYGVDDTLFLRFREDKLSDSDWERLRMKRQALHAAELTLLHPRHQEPVTYNAPLPDDMNGLLKGSASYNTGLASSSSC